MLTKNAVFVAASIWFALSFMAGSAYARGEYLQWWNEVYPASSADDSVCQLCHERGGGGDGWNSYGWSIRGVYFINLAQTGNSETALKDSLSDIESVADGGGATYRSEINANAQPGWRVGEVNVINARNNPQKTIAPPSTLPCALLIDQNDSELTCSTTNPIPSNIAKQGEPIELETIASGFTAPVAAVSAPEQDGILYVVEQGGKVWRVQLNNGEKRLFLDFSSQLVSNFGQLFSGSSFEGYDERGLLGFAFHPDFATNNKVVTYISSDYIDGQAHFTTLANNETPDHMTVVSEWVVVNPFTADSQASAQNDLLIIDQPQFNHNGGMLEFGPDGYLYIAVGDGGSANDAGTGHGLDGNGRDNTNPLGAILRIDVDDPAPDNGRYGIPATNPFVGQAGVDEIFVYGLRNPYRFAIETNGSGTSDLYIGDVGQDAIEELNRIPLTGAGSNFGWNYKEGSFYFSVINGVTFVSPNPPSGVVIPPLVDPLVEYDHEEGISIIAGYTYRGNDVSWLNNRYVFADWGRSFANPDGRLFFLNQQSQLREFNMAKPVDIHITGFGRDDKGELYVVGSKDFRATVQSGSLQKIVKAEQELCVPIKAQNNRIAVVCL